MNHFAYPNVIPKKGLFIGCGRYGVLSQGAPLGKAYREVGETPNTPNRSHLEYTLQLLSPASYDSNRIVVEKQDQPKYRYQGNSLDLAYFLAHTHRSKELKKQVSSDIWCTGAIEVKDSTPFLHKVDEKGFQLKLRHFLDKENRDKLFIVPAANMQKENLATATALGAEVKSIHQLKGNFGALNIQTKTILKVLPNEPPELIALFFKTHNTSHRRNKWPIVGLVILTALLSGLWFYFKPNAPSISDIEKLLKAGNLISAKEIVTRSKESSPQLNKVWSLMNTPNDIEVTMKIQKNGSDASKQLMLEEKTPSDLILSHKDDYRLIISAGGNPETLYLYIFQIDELDQAYCIFPNVKWKLENPIEASQWPVSIPRDEKDWLYLDQLPPDRTDGIKETLHILASPWRAEDVESNFNAIVTETDRNARKVLIKGLQTKLDSRKTAGIPSIEYRKFSFFHN